MSDNGSGGMSGEQFSDFMARERDRLRAEREQIFNQQEELQRKLDAVNREYAAIEAYETTKTGKNARQAPARRQRQGRGSRRGGLLELIREGNGLSRGDILERMGLKGDKAGEMSVSNALTALAKSNQVRRDGGKYYPAMPDQGEAELPLGAPDSLFEWPQLLVFLTGMGLRRASRPDKTPTRVRRAVATSRHPARSRNSPPQCASHPKLRSTTQRRGRTRKPLAAGSRSTT